MRLALSTILVLVGLFTSYRLFTYFTDDGIYRYEANRGCYVVNYNGPLPFSFAKTGRSFRGRPFFDVEPMPERGLQPFGFRILYAAPGNGRVRVMSPECSSGQRTGALTRVARAHEERCSLQSSRDVFLYLPKNDAPAEIQCRRGDSINCSADIFFDDSVLRVSLLQNAPGKISKISEVLQNIKTQHFEIYPNCEK